MSDIFDTEQPARLKRPASPRRDALSVEAPAALAVAAYPAGEGGDDAAERRGAEALEIADKTLADIQREKMKQGAGLSDDRRVLSDEQRLRVSKVVDFRLPQHKRGRITAEDMRRVLLELIANL